MSVVVDPEMLLLGFLCPLCARPRDPGTQLLVCGHHLPGTVGAEVSIHRIELPYPVYPKYPALNANLRGTRWDTNADVQAVRADVMRLARHAGCTPGEHLTVHLAWSPARRNGHDADNLAPMMKACCDALARGSRRLTLKNPGVNIGLDLVPDDRPEHMSKIMPVILPKGDPPGMWLTVIIHR